jgi:hypothetical protein
VIEWRSRERERAIEVLYGEEGGEAREARKGKADLSMNDRVHCTFD